jgi:hypothetical protein
MEGLLLYATAAGGFAIGWLLCALLSRDRTVELERLVRAALDDRDVWRRRCEEFERRGGAAPEGWPEPSGARQAVNHGKDEESVP